MAQILASDWNPLVTSLQSILTGWGQTYSGYTVANLNKKVDHLDWNALVADVNKCYVHITGSNSSLSTVGTGTRITQANLTNASAAVSYISSNQYTVAPANVTTSAVVNNAGGTWGAWTTFYQAVATVSWPSAASYSQFWNAGGKLTLKLSGSAGDAWSQEIVNLLNNSGTLTITATTCSQSGQTWTGTVGFQGAINVGSGGSTWLTLLNPDTGYTADNMTVTFTPNGNFGSASSVAITITLNNGRTTLGGAPNTINGSFFATITEYYPYSTGASGTSVGSTQA